MLQRYFYLLNQGNANTANNKPYTLNKITDYKLLAILRKYKAHSFSCLIAGEQSVFL